MVLIHCTDACQWKTKNVDTQAHRSHCASCSVAVMKLKGHARQYCKQYLPGFTAKRKFLSISSFTLVELSNGSSVWVTVTPKMLLNWIWKEHVLNFCLSAQQLSTVGVRAPCQSIYTPGSSVAFLPFISPLTRYLITLSVTCPLMMPRLNVKTWPHGCN